MANFKTHIGVAFSGSLLASIAVYSTGLVTSLESLLLTMVGTIGGVLPDIDSKHSKATQLIFYALSATLACLLLFELLPYFGILLSVFLALIIFYIGNNLLKKICLKFTCHRGIIHSPAVGLLFGVILAYLSAFLIPQLATWLGIFLCFGFIIHLILDEMYSVDFEGKLLKKSFGTAFTLFSFRQPFKYFALYAILVCLYVYYPGMMLFQKEIESVSWGTIKQHFFLQKKHIKNQRNIGQKIVDIRDGRQSTFKP